jgi:putative SOS response-associated peptidase YedK
MCGRYSIASKLEDIEKKFLAKFKYDFTPVYNCAPSLKLPVITCEEPQTIQAFRWGYLPHYEKNLNKGLINARSEGVNTSKAFLKSIRERRCLVLANCFYEWSKDSKQPYLIFTEQRLFAFAGIYREWKNNDTGECINSFAILTMGPTKVMDFVNHHRSPAILKPSQWQTWLKKDDPLAKISEVLSEPYEKMNAYPVSKEINKPVNNTREIMNPIGDRVIQEKKQTILAKPGNPDIIMGDRK